MLSLETRVAKAVLDIKATGFILETPVTFKSGIISPVYVDNRIFPFNPREWKPIIYGFGELIEERGILYDIFAGVEAAGIPHSAALGFALDRPSVFVRKLAKDHGKKKRVEGGNVSNLRVLLVEDHVTTAGSSLESVMALRDEGAIVSDCLAITTYGFPEASEAFIAAGVTLHALTTFGAILEEAVSRNLLTEREKQIIADWLKDPYSWGKETDADT